MELIKAEVHRALLAFSTRLLKGEQRQPPPSDLHKPFDVAEGDKVNNSGMKQGVRGSGLGTGLQEADSLARRVGDESSEPIQRGRFESQAMSECHEVNDIRAERRTFVNAGLTVDYGNGSLREQRSRPRASQPSAQGYGAMDRGHTPGREGCSSRTSRSAIHPSHPERTQLMGRCPDYPLPPPPPRTSSSNHNLKAHLAVQQGRDSRSFYDCGVTKSTPKDDAASPGSVYDGRSPGGSVKSSQVRRRPRSHLPRAAHSSPARERINSMHDRRGIPAAKRPRESVLFPPDPGESTNETAKRGSRLEPKSGEGANASQVDQVCPLSSAPGGPCTQRGDRGTRSVRKRQIALGKRQGGVRNSGSYSCRAESMLRLHARGDLVGLRLALSRADPSASGVVSKQELQRVVLRRLGVGLSRQEVMSLATRYRPRGDAQNAVDYNNLIDALERTEAALFGGGWVRNPRTSTTQEKGQRRVEPRVPSTGPRNAHTGGRSDSWQHRNLDGSTPTEDVQLVRRVRSKALQILDRHGPRSFDRVFHLVDKGTWLVGDWRTTPLLVVLCFPNDTSTAEAMHRSRDGGSLIKVE